MNKFFGVLRENVLDIIMLAGMILISIGCFTITTTIGLIVTGVLLILISIIVAKGDD